MSDQEMKELMCIKEFLPGEGESIVITRQGGKLHTGKISLTLSQEGGLFKHEKELGKLLALDKKLSEVGFGCSIFFSLVFVAGWLIWTHFETSQWYVYLGTIVVVGIIYFQLDQWYSNLRERQIFAVEGIDIVTNVMRSLQLSEGEMLVKISQTDKLKNVESCYSYYLNT